MKNKLFSRFSLMLAMTILFGVSIVSGRNKKKDFPRRIAPLKTDKIAISKGLVLTKPQITEHFTADFSSEEGKPLEWIPVIETFSFKIETSSADLTVANVQIEIESCTGTKEIFKADSQRIRPDGEIRIEANYQVGRRMLFCAGTQEIQFFDYDRQEVITTAQGELNLTAEGLQMFRNAIAYLLEPEFTEEIFGLNDLPK